MASCEQGGGSVAGIAMVNSVNANQVRRRMRERGIEPPTWRLPMHVIEAAPAMTAAFSCRWRRPNRLFATSGSRFIEAKPRSRWGGGPGIRRLRCLVARLAAIIRVDALWLSTRPLDMRAGTETILAQVFRIFGEALAHHAYLFANRCGARPMSHPSRDFISLLFEGSSCVDCLQGAVCNRVMLELP